MRASCHIRMMEKIELVKDELFKKSEVLNDLYSSGLLEGATEQLLGSPFGNAFHKPIFLGLVLSRILASYRSQE